MLLGGFKITRVEWLSSHSINVRFSSTYGTAFHYQLYAGRTRIGATNDVSARQITGQLQPSAWPQHLTVVAVDPADRLEDFGDLLPLRPYNRVRVNFDVADPDGDAQQIEVAAGTEPGGDVDPENIVAQEFFDVPRRYTLTTSPLPGSGTWKLAVAVRDDKPPEGNLGPALELQADILATPPDLVMTGGDRFGLEIADAQATFTFTLP